MEYLCILNTDNSLSRGDLNNWLGIWGYMKDVKKTKQTKTKKILIPGKTKNCLRKKKVVMAHLWICSLYYLNLCSLNLKKKYWFPYQVAWLGIRT